MLVQFLNLVVMVALAAVAAYAQYRLPYHSASRAQANLTRAVLAITGLGLGWLATVWQPAGGLWPDLVAFVSGFGLVHVPAAFILWSKRARGVYR